MAGKSFKQAPKIEPQPSDASIEAFVQSGAGKDTQKSVKEITQKSVSDEKPKRLTVDMPPALHKRYKALCASNDLRMNDDIRQMIERRCEELEG